MSISKWDRDRLIILGLFVALILGALFLFLVSDQALVRNVAAVNYLSVSALVLVTCFYAIETREIAVATKSLAAESVEQRYAEFQPVIDIHDMPSSIQLMSQGLAAQKGQYPEHISCNLSNIGKGPALEMAYEAVHSGNLVVPLSEPTMLPGQIVNSVLGPDASTEISKPSKLTLKVEQDDDGFRSIRVRYRDVFGRHFISSKAVVLEEKECYLGPLKFERDEAHS